MTRSLHQTLVTARALFLEGKHRAFGMVMLPDLLSDAAHGDENLADKALETLDECTPHPWTFGMFIDGAKGDGSFGYDRTKAEIAAVFGRACVRASR